MSIFKGAGVAIVTPMNEDESVNYGKLEELIEEQIAGGTDAIIICGTTGESACLTVEEHLETIRETFLSDKKRKPADFLSIKVDGKPLESSSSLRDALLQQGDSEGADSALYRDFGGSAYSGDSV